MERVRKEAALNRFNTREVLFFVDQVGGSGKSAFCKWCEFNSLAGCYGFGTSKDLMSEVSKDPPRSSYIFDLTRAKPDDNSFSDLCNTIEQIKNGRITNHKYEVRKRMQLPALVIVFSNQLPAAEVINLLSKDR